MGRGKLSLELIKNEKSRVLTFRKRLKGLMKKAHEFTTLCGVKACMIIYGPPNLKGMPTTVDIWPSDSAEVKAVIDQYKEAADLFETKLKKPFNLVDFFAVRRRMINDEIAKLRRKGSLEAKYPIRDDQIKNLSLNQVKILNSKFDSKIEAAKSKLKTMKRGQYLMELEVSKSGNVPNFSNFQSNLDFEVSEPEFHTQLPPYCCPYDQSIQFQPYGYDITPVDNPMMTLLMQDELPSGASSKSSAHNGLVPFSEASHYDPPTAASMVDNGMFNNRCAVPVQYIGPPVQPMSGHYQAVASLPSQVHVPHFGKYYWDIN
ncbi:hypothetical protein SLA2020_093720 [Shorea laevis]